jgi:hypothetical protein
MTKVKLLFYCIWRKTKYLMGIGNLKILLKGVRGCVYILCHLRTEIRRLGYPREILTLSARTWLRGEGIFPPFTPFCCAAENPKCLHSKVRAFVVKGREGLVVIYLFNMQIPYDVRILAEDLKVDSNEK